MSELAPLITDLGIILVVAGCVMILFKWLKQPVILGYIVAGFITGPSVSFLPTVSDTSDIKIWADIGVIFLLFARIGVFFPQAFECRLECYGGYRYYCVRYDVLGICGGKYDGIFSYYQSFFGRNAFYVVYGDCF